MIPMVILYLIFQKQFIQGIAMTGGKMILRPRIFF